jgi:hypothetical protein
MTAIHCQYGERRGCHAHVLIVALAACCHSARIGGRKAPILSAWWQRGASCRKSLKAEAREPMSGVVQQPPNEEANSALLARCVRRCENGQLKEQRGNIRLLVDGDDLHAKISAGGPTTGAWGEAGLG